MFQTQAARSLWRGFVAALAFAIPLGINAFPEIANLTVGGVLFAALHYLEKTTIAGITGNGTPTLG